MSVNSIELRKVRDFGEVLNATFSFLRENFLNILKTCLPVALPVVLIGCLLSGFASSFEVEGWMNNIVSFLLSDIIPNFLNNPIITLGILLFNISVYEYIRLYLTHPKEQITLKLVWSGTRKYFFPLIGLSIVFLFMVAVGLVLFVVPGIYMVIPYAFSYVIYVMEQQGIGATVNRSFNLLKNEWWSSLGLAIIMVIVQIVLESAIVLPYNLITAGVELHDLAGGLDVSALLKTSTGSLLAAVYLLVHMLTSSIQFICISVKYFSIVETKEGTGMIQKIEQMQPEPV